MCGGYELEADPEALVRAFRVDHAQEPLPLGVEHFPRMQGPIVIVRRSEAGEPERWLGAARWGLVPHWAKDPSVGDKLFNARAETLAQKPSFRESFERRRCLVPVTGFYEWRREREGGKSQRFVFRPTDGPLLALAGLWARWRSPSGDKLGSYTIVTVPANQVVGAIHARMPLILSPEGQALWLEPEAAPEALSALLLPSPDAGLRVEPG